MIPHEPPRNPLTGYLYFPPYRVQGYSIAGEETYVQLPELDVCFDIGRAPRLALTSNHVALSHGHMDHVAGAAYYFSQRHFQGMGTGTILCHPDLVEPLRRMMTSWEQVEAQRTPYRILPLDPESDGFELKNNIFLRSFRTEHTVPSLGYTVMERRSKLRDEYVGLPQPKLVELKAAGEEITYTRRIPLVAYMGDTGPCDAFLREDVANARILITECTFIDSEHRQRARVGKHLHISDLCDILPQVNSEFVVLTHLSRRTHIFQAREELDRALPAEHRDRVFLMMDSKTNRARYQKQFAEAEAQEQAREAGAASES
ncbi:MAG: MBL fold metallo-hydrolase [Phycisphaerae bacterium]|nr:MBL fold metallo-hydrolase [Phycisphaerae bacterium]